ncbi:GTPase [Winogradskyella ursingii]|uniref:GTPase n=1 Tax=Winogradskyella ursingii TaxID=2686079 RepID=UPI0015CE61FF|nr:GTPase [Winogradskyella ursingii]
MKLLFVYNAKSSKLNALLDTGHKLLSPSTYKCQLCALTFDTFSEDKTWRKFREDSNIDMKFFHKDEFEARFPNVNLIYPTVLKLEGNQLTTVITNEILEGITNVEDLIVNLKSNI